MFNQICLTKEEVGQLGRLLLRKQYFEPFGIVIAMMEI